MGYKFPSDLNAERPCIIFQCTGGPQIALPAPGSLAFSDAVTYNDSSELGVRGAMTAGAAGKIASDGLSLDTLTGVAGDAFSKLKSAITGNSIGGIMQGIAAATGIGDNYKSAISIGTGTTINKNITTEFTSTNTRVFTFDFQLIPQNSAESNSIRDIVKAFRENVYPEGNEFQLKYPPKWEIKYTKLKNVPTIGEVYLTQVNTSYNTSMNIWRSDGSPVETSIQLQFMETKAHTRNTLPGSSGSRLSNFTGDINIPRNTGAI